ncbi:hypothetical protein BH23GEM11_BH23GEM11_07100 [soil metagenome]
MKRRLRPVAGALAALALLSTPSAAQESGTELSFRLGVAGGAGVQPGTLVPGLEFRTGGTLHMLFGVDAYLPRRGERGVLAMPSDTARREVTRSSLSPPRLRAGVGWHPPLWGTSAGRPGLELRGYAGQQGLIEGFQPMVGGGAVLGLSGWGLGVDGGLYRATVYERVGLPEHPGLVGETPLRRTWAPRWELSARGDVGAVPRDVVVPVLVGAGAGAAGGLLGGLALALVSDCSGETCAGPFIIGAVLGETLALPLAVHLAEGGRGSLGLVTLASLGVTVAGAVAMIALPNADVSQQGIAVLVPFGQIVAAIATERRTARRRPG